MSTTLAFLTRYAVEFSWALLVTITFVCLVALAYAGVEQFSRRIFHDRPAVRYSGAGRRWGEVLMWSGIGGVAIVAVSAPLLLGESARSIPERMAMLLGGASPAERVGLAIGTIFVMVFDVGVWTFLSSERIDSPAHSDNGNGSRSS